MERSGGRLAIELDPVVFGPEDRERPADVVDGPHLRFRISDTGIGMDAATAAHIFEPFFTTKPFGKGTGLGLSVVHGIVRDHGGCIAVRTAPGAGTTFDVFLPVVAPTHSDATHDEIGVPRVDRRVLLVDDEVALLRTTQRLLEQAGHRVTTCDDPRRAVDLVRAQPSAFDVLVTDHEMPDLNGLELTKRLRAIVPGLPTVLCSGFLRPSVVEEIDREHGIAVVQKPATAAQLSAAMAEAAGASA
jgi:CheY-like chemotaxis protein